MSLFCSFIVSTAEITELPDQHLSQVPSGVMKQDGSGLAG